MLSKDIRPILMAELTRVSEREERFYLAAKAKPEGQGWAEQAALDQSWREARLQRAQLELQLWLADRELEREAEEAGDKAVSKVIALGNALLTGKT